MMKSGFEQKSTVEQTRPVLIRALTLLGVVILLFLNVGTVHADAAGIAWGAAATAGSVTASWIPDLPWSSGRSAYLNWTAERYIKPQCGPGYQYQTFRSMNGSKHLYSTSEITRADIYFTTGDWAYVGFGYSDQKWRFGFFHVSVFTPYDGWDYIPEYTLDYEMRGTVTGTVIPKNGPGWDYPQYESCKLSSGDTVYACMQSNGWYLCRFYNDHSNKYGYVYLWVPGSMIWFD